MKAGFMVGVEPLFTAYGPQIVVNGGERGIRTPGTLPGSTVFKTAALNHSAISPQQTRRASTPACVPGLRPGRDHLETIHERAQRRRHHHRPVRLLVVLQD